ncbi:MAG: GNAT family N-acetyltransferase [Chroococcales cyanobacterium]
MIKLVDVSEVDNCAHIYGNAVVKTAKHLYTEKQIKAWSAFPQHQDKFEAFILNCETYGKYHEKKLVGFCGLANDGHIVSLYVSPDYNRQGIGSELLNYVLVIGKQKEIQSFYTEASYLSKPVFEKAGFVVDEIEVASYDDVEFSRFKMVKVY